MYKLIFYLYYEHGIVLVNRVNHNALFKHFENINVTDVLITGSNSYKWILQSFNPNNTRVGIVEHPSLNNQIGDAVNIWDRFNSDRVQRYENFEKVLLDSFTAIKLQSAIIYEVSE